MTAPYREITTHIADPDHEPGNQPKLAAMDEPGPGGANHYYLITNPDGIGAYAFWFQKGGIAENGVNGITNEALLAMVADRLECFQNGPFANRYNASALISVQLALEALHNRTRDRIKRGVEGKEQA